MVRCPSCARDVRPSDTELGARRGACPVCDAPYVIAREESVGDGPHRRAALIRAELPASPPSTRMRIRRRRALLRLSVSSSRARTRPGVDMALAAAYVPLSALGIV